MLLDPLALALGFRFGIPFYRMCRLIRRMKLMDRSRGKYGITLTSDWTDVIDFLSQASIVISGGLFPVYDTGFNTEIGISTTVPLSALNKSCNVVYETICQSGTEYASSAHINPHDVNNVLLHVVVHEPPSAFQ